MTFTPKAIEAAARALCVQSGDDPDKLTYAHAMQCTGHDREPKFTWQYWMPFAEAALAAALAVDGLALQGWRPIDSAPKDGSEIWAFNGEQARMKWFESDGTEEGYSLWIWADELSCDVDPSPEQPTHWQPLPQPPAASDREERNTPPPGTEG